MDFWTLFNAFWKISVATERKLIFEGYQYRYFGEVRNPLNESFCQSWIFTPLRPSIKASEGSLSGKMWAIEQSRDGDASRGYKYCNDRSSNVTAFTTNHSCVSRALSGGEKKESISLPRSVQQGLAPAPAGFSGLRGRSGQTCNFSDSHPAAYFFLSTFSSG